MELKLDDQLKRFRHVRLGRLPLTRPVLWLNNAAAMASHLFFAPNGGVTVEKQNLPGRGGDIPAHIFRPKDVDGALPVLLYFHGGGFIARDFGYLRRAMCDYAATARCAVVYVLYRLAPKHPFPAAFFDACDSYRWLLKEGAAQGLDTARLAVGGDSAGGCLTAALTLWARNEGLPTPQFQLLIYPVLDHTLSSGSMKTLADVPGCNPHLLRQMWGHYLKEGVGELPLCYASPHAAEDLSGLPAAFIETEQYDSLCDEGRLYAERLAAAGVPAQLIQRKGTFHAFDVAQKTGIARQAVAQRAAALKAALWPDN